MRYRKPKGIEFKYCCTHKFPSTPPPFLSHNPPDGTFPKLPHGAIFTVCPHTFTLF